MSERETIYIINIIWKADQKKVFWLYCVISTMKSGRVKQIQSLICGHSNSKAVKMACKTLMTMNSWQNRISSIGFVWRSHFCSSCTMCASTSSLKLWRSMFTCNFLSTSSCLSVKIYSKKVSLNEWYFISSTYSRCGWLERPLSWICNWEYGIRVRSQHLTRLRRNCVIGLNWMNRLDWGWFLRLSLHCQQYWT